VRSFLVELKYNHNSFWLDDINLWRNTIEGIGRAQGFFPQVGRGGLRFLPPSTSRRVTFGTANFCSSCDNVSISIGKTVFPSES
jgi:hypothetical protein